MKIIIELEPNDLKDNTIANSIVNLLRQNKAITDTIDVEPIEDAPFEDCDFVEDVTKQKSKVKTKEERVTELKKYANSIWKDLSDAKKKSLKSFVSFYEKKINEENFTINVENQFKKWWERDKNNK